MIDFQDDMYQAQKEPDTTKLIHDSGDSNSNWGFGQVVAIVLLLAPLITIIEYFNHGILRFPFRRSLAWRDANGMH